VLGAWLDLMILEVFSNLRFCDSFFQVLLELMSTCTFQRHQLIPLWTQCVARPYASHLGAENSTDGNVGLNYLSTATQNFCVRGNERTELLKGDAIVSSQDCPFSPYSPFAAFCAERSMKVFNSVDAVPSFRVDIFLQGIHKMFCCLSEVDKQIKYMGIRSWPFTISKSFLKARNGCVILTNLHITLFQRWSEPTLFKLIGKSPVKFCSTCIWVCLINPDTFIN